MRETLRRAGRRTWRLPLVALLILAGVACALCMPASRPGRPVPTQPLSLWSRAFCRLLGVRTVTQGLPTSATALLVANHISWLDIFCIASVHPTHFLAKREVANWPLIGWLTRRAGTAFIRRGGENGAQDAAEQLIWRLRQGEYLLIFPEGTSTDGKTVKRFYPRLFQAAIHAERPVQAIALHYPYGRDVHPQVPFVGDDDFLTHLWVLLGETGIVAELHFREPLRSNSRDFLAKQTHQQIVKALDTRSAQRQFELRTLRDPGVKSQGHQS